MSYIGRFAPSPTGPLHLGSLVTALASYLDAKAHHGQWLMRMENLDPPREMPNADKLILSSLRDHGLHWDGELLWQSERSAAYEQALKQLLSEEKAFYCSCSRRDLAPSDGIHSHCLRPAVADDCAIRLRNDREQQGFEDLLQGHYLQNLRKASGDFVLKRRDGLYAYQLAVVVDDAYSNINCIVRGADLLDSTPKQIQLQQQLGLPSPQYLHLPLLVNTEGQKLSKRAYSKAINSQSAADNLRLALKVLQQAAVPATLQSCEAILKYASRHWQRQNLPQCTEVLAPEALLQ